MREFSTTKIFLPVKDKEESEEIDEEYIKNIVKTCYGWSEVLARSGLSENKS